MKRRAWIAFSAGVAIAILGITGAEPGDGDEQAPDKIDRLHWEDATAIKISVSKDLVDLGRKTYGTRCVICHGKEGKGDGLAAHYLETKPRDFTKAIFKYRSTPQGTFPKDEDLFRSITVGFPMYGMPSFRSLSARERWGVVYYVKKLTRDGFTKSLQEDEVEANVIKEVVEEAMAPGKALDVGTSREETDQAVAKGKKIYEKAGCAQCHGNGGMGDGPSAKDQQDVWGNDISPAPFALSPYYMKAGGRPRDIVRVLMTGIGGTPMPKFEWENQEDYWNIAYYVLQLARERAKKDQ